MKVKSLLDPNRLFFFCPGCNEDHCVTVNRPSHPVWSYNGNPEAPTFTPSILVKSHHWEPPVTGDNLDEWERAPWEQKKVDTVCHSFVTDGRIQFLGDCTHTLAGKTVDLPDWETS